MIVFQSAGVRLNGDTAAFTIHTKDKDAVLSFLSTMQNGKRYCIEPKEYFPKRSLDANGYFWALLHKLAAKIRKDPDSLYRDYIREIGDNHQVVCCIDTAKEKLLEGWGHNGTGWVAVDLGPSKVKGCSNICLYYGSSTYDSAQMARLIDLVVQDCKEQGIETMTPDQIARLKGLEDEK